jgi:hypothetical protein
MDRFTREQVSKGMFSDDQMDYMEALAALPREAKCACGWHRTEECSRYCASPYTRDAARQALGGGEGAAR